MKECKSDKFKQILKEMLETILGALIMAAGVSLFLLPNQLSSGGIAGVATIFYYLLNIPMGTVIIAINIPLFLFSMYKVGKMFFIKSIVGTVAMSIFIDLLDKIKPLTNDRFLACIYGGILLKDVSAFGIYLDFGILSYPLTLFFILGCINCMNLIDGLDGLSGGISSIYYLTIGIIATIQGKHGLDFVLTFVMLGSTLGFLVYNFNPAKIFAGDSGSNFMGFIIAVIALLGFKNVTMTSLIVPLFVLAIPILDTLFAIIRRTLKGEPISQGDSYHIHHQLLRRNLSVKQTVLIIYLVDILFATASIVYILKDRYLGYIIYGILLALVLVFVINTNVIYNFKDSSKEKKHE